MRRVILNRFTLCAELQVGAQVEITSLDSVHNAGLAVVACTSTVWLIPPAPS